MITSVISFDGHVFATDYEVDYVSGTRPRLPPAKVETLRRIGAWPVIVALQRNPHTHALLINIVDLDNVDTLRTQLMRWFDPEDETPKVLVCENQDGVEMYGYALCQELRLYSTPRFQQVFVATLVADGDVRWRSTATASDAWAVTATAQTQDIVNAGEDEAYPVFTFEPTTGKTGGYDWRAWVAVPWTSENAGSTYPLLAEMDTATPVGAGKMQADGDDLRVLVDGLEVDRWLDDMNAAATKVWFNADFAGAPGLTLATQIAAAGDIASIEFNEETEVALLPESGILLIDDEAFVYTARSLVDAAVTGITRAAKGTDAALHTVDDDVYWMQHDVYILYGNAAATAPTQTACLKPIFDLDTSSNDSWVFSTFGYPECSGSGSNVQWTRGGPITPGGNSGCYTGSEWGVLLPSQLTLVLGLWREVNGAFGNMWELYNPCGIVNADWADGKKCATVVTELWGSVRYWSRGAGWWTTQYQIPDPGVSNAWEAWTKTAGAAWDPADSIAITLHSHDGGTDFTAVEAGTVTVSLYATETPDVVVGAEQGNYELSCTLTNEETGEAITIAFVMDLDTELEVDTDARTVTWLADDSGQFQAVSLSTARRHWLRLLPGSNTFRFDDVGTGHVTLTTEGEERYY